MFYPCTVKDKDGKVKKKYSSKQLKKRHWEKFLWSRALNHGTSKKRKDLYEFKEDDINF